MNSIIKSGTNFCHYTTVEAAKNILNSERFYLSRFSSMNDLSEAKAHENDQARVFSLCFCHSESMNIPLFYLYSGIDGKGCRIQFTDTKIRTIIENAEVFYVNKSNRCLKKKAAPSDYEIFYDWVYYVTSSGYYKHHGEEGQFDLKTMEETLHMTNTDLFVKNMIWKYENEFRIVIKFKNDISYEKVALKFNVGDNEKGISVMFGPETTDDEYVALVDEFRDYGVSKTKRYSKNKIAMGLVDKNRYLYRK